MTRERGQLEFVLDVLHAIKRTSIQYHIMTLSNLCHKSLKPLLRKLEAKGLVKVESKPNKRKRIFLTGEGEEMLRLLQYASQKIGYRTYIHDSTKYYQIIMTKEEKEWLSRELLAGT